MMSNADPNLHWDGYQWLHWDGVDWRPPTYPVQPAIQPSYPVAYGLPARVVYPPMAYAPSGIIVTDRQNHNTQAVIAWILTVLTLFYFLPWAIAATRGKSNSGMIGLLNFLLGWTFVGWVVALVMACTSHQIISATSALLVQHPSYSQTPPGFAPPPARYPPPPPIGPPHN